MAGCCIFAARSKLRPITARIIGAIGFGLLTAIYLFPIIVTESRGDVIQSIQPPALMSILVNSAKAKNYHNPETMISVVISLLNYVGWGCVALMLYLSPALAAASTPASTATGCPVLKCRRCGGPSVVGTFRCSSCGRSLRPVVLDLCTLIGPFVLAWMVLDALRRIVLETGQTHTSVESVATIIVVNVAGILVLLGLRYGRYWAWVAAHIVWLINMCILMSIAIFNEVPFMYVRVGAYAILTLILAQYVHRPYVRTFCSVRAK